MRTFFRLYILYCPEARLLCQKCNKKYYSIHIMLSELMGVVFVWASASTLCGQISVLHVLSIISCFLNIQNKISFACVTKLFLTQNKKKLYFREMCHCQKKVGIITAIYFRFHVKHILRCLFYFGDTNYSIFSCVFKSLNSSSNQLMCKSLVDSFVRITFLSQY